MHNVKVIHYPNGKQVSFYEKAVFGVDDDCPDEDNPFMGRHDVKKDTYNPFTEEYEHILNFDSKERSLRSSLSRTINRIYYLSRSNIWDWFVTLTFNPDKVNSFDYSECVEKLGKWLNNCKRNCPNMKYIVVPEKHESGRFHFHGLFADCDALGFVDSGHITRNGQTIYNIGRYRLGFTTATKIDDNEKATKYICKYISKDLVCVTCGKKRYWCSRNLDEAPVETLFLDREQLENLKLNIEEDIKHISRRSGHFQSVEYVEL